MNKQEIRQIYKQKRQQLTNEQREIASLQLFNRTCNQFNLEDKKVSIFLPIQRFYEINTWPFLLSLPSTDFYLPVVKGPDKLVHILFENKEQIQVSEWGIPEPIYGTEVEPNLFDYVLVPLLAIDKKGYRVGYGKGFYDQFLKQCKPNCKFIGLSYFEPIDQVFDLHEGDVPLHMCITPNDVFNF